MIGVGVDIGGTFIKFMAVTPEGGIIKEDKIPTMPQEGPKAFLDRIGGVLNDWTTLFKGKKLVVGIGIAGDVDPVKGMLRFSPNLNKCRNVHITEPLEKMTGLPCVAENDANMAAWGAYDFELKGKYPSVLTITLGTGVGGGIVLDRKLYHGATGSAGEVGHIKITIDGELCACGNRGCLEAYISNAAITRRAEQALLKAPDKSILKKMCSDGRVTTLALSQAADEGDPIALSIWKESGTYLGRGIADIILVLNPDALLFTGGVSGAAKHFFPAMQEVFAQTSITTPFKHLKVAAASTPNLGGIGAALYALEHYKEK